tara:strand:- start:73 stop:369 length:297 start_codon:yes stop_codon:yes gene_type:complete
MSFLKDSFMIAVGSVLIGAEKTIDAGKACGRLVDDAKANAKKAGVNVIVNVAELREDIKNGVPQEKVRNLSLPKRDPNKKGFFSEIIENAKAEIEANK